MTNKLQKAREKKDKITSWRNGKCKNDTWIFEATKVRITYYIKKFILLMLKRRVCITTSRNAKVYRKPFQDTFQERKCKKNWKD